MKNTAQRLLDKVYANEMTIEQLTQAEDISAVTIKEVCSFFKDNEVLVGREYALTLSIIKSVLDKGESRTDYDVIMKFIKGSEDVNSTIPFKSEEMVSMYIKNQMMFYLIEVVRFSQMQKKNLKDTASYNRHLEKSLSDMTFAIAVSFELGSEVGEIESLLDKYFEFNYYVNTVVCWEGFNSLKVYEEFNKFTMKNEDMLFDMYEKTNLKYESIKDYIEAQNEKAIGVFSKVLIDKISDGKEDIHSAIALLGEESYNRVKEKCLENNVNIEVYR